MREMELRSEQHARPAARRGTSLRRGRSWAFKRCRAAAAARPGPVGRSRSPELPADGARREVRVVDVHVVVRRVVDDREHELTVYLGTAARLACGRCSQAHHDGPAYAGRADVDVCRGGRRDVRDLQLEKQIRP